MRLLHTHFTATAGGIVLNGDGRVLLLKHRYRTGSGWGIPGGFIERGEQPVEALKRELREEVGLEISDEQIVYARSFPHLRQIEILFLCRAASEAQPQSAEVIEAEWFACENLPAGLPDDQRALLSKILEQQ
jgi:8-oxo-dGTP diphosphatase